MSRYASDTSVSVDRSRSEIEAILRRYKADQFGYATNARGAAVMFTLGGRHIRFVLPLPDPHAREFTHTPAKGLPRTAAEAERAWGQACRQRWRALALVIKAKLEAVAAGVTTIEDEFLSHTMLPDGSTMGDWAKPQIERAYAIGAMPQSLIIEGPK